MNFFNGGQTTLSGAIGAGDATLTVADGTVFPAAPFHLVVDTELMTCTAILGSLLTVTRGIEGTAAAAHAAGALVTNTVTAGDYAGFATALTIGNPIFGGAHNRVLYENNSGNMAVDSGLQYDGNNFNVGKIRNFITGLSAPWCVIGAATAAAGPNNAACVICNGKVSGNVEFLQILANVGQTEGLTYGYDSSLVAFRIFSDFYGAGTEPALIFGTFSNQTKQLILGINGQVSINGAADGTGSIFTVNGNAFIGNTTADPPTTPVGGGILYVHNGALKYVGSAGTVTTLAVA